MAAFCSVDYNYDIPSFSRIFFIKLNKFLYNKFDLFELKGMVRLKYFYTFHI